MKTHKKPTQAAVILRHLKKHRKGLTTMEAFSLYGITRLAARVAEFEGYWFQARHLQEHGWMFRITRHREKTAGGSYVTRYKLAR